MNTVDPADSDGTPTVATRSSTAQRRVSSPRMVAGLRLPTQTRSADPLFTLTATCSWLTAFETAGVAGLHGTRSVLVRLRRGHPGGGWVDNGAVR